MPWWGTLLVVVLSVIGTALVTWLLTRKQGELAATEGALATERARQLEDIAKAEQEARILIANEAKSLAVQLDSIKKWYNEQREAIDVQAKEQFEKLAVDPAAIDARLSIIFGPDDADETPVTVPDAPQGKR